MNLIRKIVALPWGAKSMVVLYLSLFSGIVVALQYDPAAPYYSASSLDILVPYGAFWRSLHFYASQLFFLFIVIHLFAVIFEDSIAKLNVRRWVLLIFSSVASLLLLFTGYLLRDDATGNAAGAIAENIILSIPLIGKFLNSLLFSISDSGMGRVYANHLVGLCVLWIFLCWDHIRRYSVNWKSHPLLVVSVIFFCAFAGAPMEPDSIGVFYISGPWFFMGLQEILRYIQPFWAGIFFPAILLGALILLHPHFKCRRRALYCILIWILVYVGFTLTAFWRSEFASPFAA